MTLSKGTYQSYRERNVHRASICPQYSYILGSAYPENGTYLTTKKKLNTISGETEE